MRSALCLCAAALVLAASGTAMAQSSSSAAPVPALAPATDIGATRTHWTGSGFVGANYGSSTSDFSIQKRRSIDFGGGVSYLWKGIVGGEFLADFTPNFGVSSFLVPENPHVNTYMGNAIGVLPIGAKGQFQPYASGGWGGVQARFPNVPTSATNTQSISQFTSGSNLGTGIMMFAGKVGVRADARYYRARDNNSTSGNLADQATQALVSGLSFWRTNIGVAFQF